MEFEHLEFEVISLRNMKVYKSLIPLEYRLYLRNRNVISMGLAQDGVPLVAMIARNVGYYMDASMDAFMDASMDASMGASMELVWIQVHGLVRRQGLGQHCLERLGQLCLELGLPYVTVDYALDSPQMDVATAFLDSCGFAPGTLDGHFITCNYNEAMGGSGSNQVISPRHSRRIQKLSKVMEERPADLTVFSELGDLHQMRGKILDDCSLAYVRRGEVVAVLVVSKVGQDVYLNGFHCLPGNLTAVMQLIFTAFSNLRQGGQSYRSINMAVVNPISRKLAHRLMSDFPYTELASYHRVWEIEKIVDENNT